MVTLFSLQPEIARIATAAELPGVATAGLPQADRSDWAGLFAEVIESLAEEVDAVSSSSSQGEISVAFEEILEPFVKTARRKLAEHSQAGWKRLTPPAQAAFEQQLLKDLATLAGRALWLEFCLFQQQGRVFLAGPTPQAPGRANYDRFVAKLAVKADMLAFFEEYPVLARLLATQMHNWLAATTAFLGRLAADWSELENTFSGPFYRVTEVRPGLSDPHLGGRQVIAFTFDATVSVVYKPRNLAVETGFQNLLGWCAARLPLDLGQVKLLPRPEYGWVEFVRPVTCLAAAGLENYYRRAGVLLGLLYLLRGNDYHYQNVIARSEYPFLADLEGLFYPPASTGDNEFTVLHTGFLPTWQVPTRGGKYDQSGLFGLGQPTGEKAEWQFTNTDRMQLAAKKAAQADETQEWPHLPSLQGEHQPARPYLYQKEVILGFRQICALLVDERTALQSEDGPLAFFRSAPVRFVFRPTQVYHDLLKLALEPKYLRSATAQRQVFERLMRVLETSNEAARLAPLVRSEIASLEKLDVPQFTVRADGLDLLLPDRSVAPGFFQASGYELVCGQLTGLDEAGITRQISYIRSAFYSYEAGWEKLDTAYLFKPGTAGFDPEMALDAAGRIARVLLGQSATGADGACWDWLDDTRPDRFYQPAGFDFSLYSGQGGIALFLAAYARVTGKQEFRQLALAAWQPFLTRLNRGDLGNRELNGLGGCSGAGSLVYGLTATAELLAEPSLLAAAGELAGWAFEDALLAQDTHYDVVSGATGAILGLLALYRQRPTPELAGRLAACGQHLLGHRVLSNGSRTWATLEGRCWSGFSHGAAGIACTLVELYRVQPIEAYREAAREALVFERSLYRPEAANWLNYPGQDAVPANLWTSWCHGAPGSGLARLGMLDILDDCGLREEVTVALETTLAQPLSGLDHLCCGNFGRLDFLLEAAVRLDRPDLVDAARERAGALLRRPGGFVLSGPRPLHLAGPGFFQGLSGIGYELLRLVEPGALKSVLLWA